jgi:hypothetical protein
MEAGHEGGGPISPFEVEDSMISRATLRRLWACAALSVSVVVVQPAHTVGQDPPPPLECGGFDGPTCQRVITCLEYVGENCVNWLQTWTYYP